MKIFGRDVTETKKGYFGVRRCTICKALRDVNLLELKGVERFLFLPVKRLGIQRYLICEKCGAGLQINDDLWNYYKTYEYRFTKETTDEIVKTLDKIAIDLKANHIELNYNDKSCENSLNMIYRNLCKQFSNPENVEELISVYFS